MYNKNSIRRAQLITPWGVGSIVPFPGDESLMIAGLDMWQFGNQPNEFIIKDERLQKRLNVNELRLPPDFREMRSTRSNPLIRIPAVRFPRWHYCPSCGTMEKLSLYQGKQKCGGHNWAIGISCTTSRKRRYLVPERFVVVCPHGHIDDFPIMEWIHSDNQPITKSCKVRRSTGGVSASLTGVYYECSCGAKKSMAGATLDGALERIGYTCKGSMPWLGVEEDREHKCGYSKVKVVQRGGTNVWFADIYSSLYIPYENLDTSKYVVKVATDFLEKINTQRVNGELNEDFMKAIAAIKNIDYEQFKDAILRMIEGKGKEIITDSMTEDSYRETEYKVLQKSSGGTNQNFHSINFRIDEYDSNIRRFFSSISLVPKVLETKAFVGFSRLQPDESRNISEKKKMLRLASAETGWLPAIQTYGEGIFFEFESQRLNEWSNSQGVKKRTKKLDANYNLLVEKRNGAKGNLNPKYVMIHTFAHILINQLSIECGYGSSSIKERIYCSKIGEENQMNGVLIYTSSGDSEGSLGGLVRQGKPGKIEDIIINSLRNALWCSSDPVCIQSTGQGPDNCNISVCHNCGLLPETCCENGNRLLDRGLLVGTLVDKSIGYFNVE